MTPVKATEQTDALSAVVWTEVIHREAALYSLSDRHLMMTLSSKHSVAALAHARWVKMPKWVLELRKLSPQFSSSRNSAANLWNEVRWWLCVVITAFSVELQWKREEKAFTEKKRIQLKKRKTLENMMHCFRLNHPVYKTVKPGAVYSSPVRAPAPLRLGLTRSCGFDSDPRPCSAKLLRFSSGSA